MEQKTFTLAAAIVFTLVALLHLWRITQGWAVVIDGTAIPMWASWAGTIVAGTLAYYGWRFGRQ